MIRKNKKGFTLIELMVVIVIIGVLAALAIPKFTDASTKAKFAEIPTVMGSYDHAQLAYISETGRAGVLDSLVFDEPVGSKWFTYTDAATPATSATYTATSAVAVGSVPATTDIASTEVFVTDSVAHTMIYGDAKKYLPNF